MKILFCIIALVLTTNTFAQPAGSLDPTFGTAGKVLVSINSGEAKAHSIALQSDGKIIAVGHSTSPLTGKDFTIVRLLSDGTLDNTFGINGIVTTDVQLGSEDYAYSVALQADGKIILAGSSDDGVNRNAALVRYNSDGTIDSTFGVNGIVLTDFENAQQDEIRVVKIHALTGNIVVGGSTVISTTVSKPVVARYLSNGTLDNTFNSNGIRLLWVTSLDYQYFYSVEDLVVQPNGKISAVGWRNFVNQSFSYDYWTCRISTDGTMDNTFSSDGVAVFNGSYNGNDRAYSMILKSNNNMILSGGAYTSTIRYDFTALEISATGTTTSWNRKVDFGSGVSATSYRIAEDNNGKYVMAGSSGTTNNKSFSLARLTSTSAIDLNFGTNGMVNTTFGANTLNECFDMAIQPDHKIVAVGYAGNDFAIARYQGDDVADLNSLQLVYPTNQATNRSFSNLVMDWTDAFGATSYEIEIDDDQTFSSSQTHTISTSSYTATNLLPNTEYFWRVKASDGTNWGTSTTVWSFKTNGLDNFYLISPTDGAVNQNYTSITLDWSDNTGSTSYEVQIDTTQSFSTTPQTYTSSTSTKSINNFLPSKTYYWRVRSFGNGTWGSWTEEWSFTTKQASTASISELEMNAFTLYPNPTTDLVYVKSNNLEGNSFVVFENSGRVVLNGTIEGALTSIQTNTLTKGVYYFQIAGADKVIQFVVQ